MFITFGSFLIGVITGLLDLAVWHSLLRWAKQRHSGKASRWSIWFVTRESLLEKITGTNSETVSSPDLLTGEHANCLATNDNGASGSVRTSAFCFGVATPLKTRRQPLVSRLSMLPSLPARRSKMELAVFAKDAMMAKRPIFIPGESESHEISQTKSGASFQGG